MEAGGWSKKSKIMSTWFLNDPVFITPTARALGLKSSLVLFYPYPLSKCWDNIWCQTGDKSNYSKKNRLTNGLTDSTLFYIVRTFGHRKKMDKGKRRRNNPKVLPLNLKNVNIIPATNATAI